MKDPKPTIIDVEPVWTGEIMGIPCAVLADGKRIIDLDAFMAKLETLTDPVEVKALASFARGTGIPEVSQ